MTGAAIFDFIDPMIIWVFRLPGNAYIGFALGIVLLALTCTIFGELFMAGVYFVNKRHFGDMSRDMVQHHNLSLHALRAKDKSSWKACNSIANEAFGKNFFSHLALFASSLWPVPFAIGWLNYRFGSVEFVMPGIGEITTAFIFIPAYILVRWSFSKVQKKLPIFRTIKRKISENEEGEEMMTYSELLGEPEKAS